MAKTVHVHELSQRDQARSSAQTHELPPPGTNTTFPDGETQRISVVEDLRKARKTSMAFWGKFWGFLREKTPIPHHAGLWLLETEEQVQALSGSRTAEHVII